MVHVEHVAVCAVCNAPTYPWKEGVKSAEHASQSLHFVLRQALGCTYLLAYTMDGGKVVWTEERGQAVVLGSHSLGSVKRAKQDQGLCVGRLHHTGLALGFVGEKVLKLHPHLTRT